MRVDGIRLQQFRSYKDAGFEFEPGVNIIVGPNASGKTNLLEALLMACSGSSFRARDSELVQFGTDWGRIDLLGSNENRSVKLKRQDNGVIKKEFELQNKSLLRLHPSKTIPVVLFEPNHLLLLHGSPEARRDYIDTLLEQLVLGYAKTRRDYRRILAQRNALLKRGGDINQLFAWNVRMSEAGALIARTRTELVERINQQLNDLYQRLADSTDTTVTISYHPGCPLDNYSSGLMKLLEEREARDRELGFTSIGPHREDVSVYFDDHPAALAASRGESRTALLALKILELEFVENARNQKPLLLLDDVFSELDGKRRQALTEVLKSYQTFITTTDADIILHHFTDHCHLIPLE